MLVINPKDVQTFDFKVGKTTYHIPSFGDLPPKLLRQFTKREDTEDAGIEMMLAILDRYAPGVTDEIGLRDVARIFAAYVEESQGLGDDAGES